MNEYVDVFDKRWTKRYKNIKMAIYSIKMIFYIVFIIGIVEIIKIITPYINDKEIVAEWAFTNTQITAMALILFLCYGLKMAGRVLFNGRR